MSFKAKLLLREIIPLKYYIVYNIFVRYCFVRMGDSHKQVDFYCAGGQEAHSCQYFMFNQTLSIGIPKFSSALQ